MRVQHIQHLALGIANSIAYKQCYGNIIIFKMSKSKYTQNVSIENITARTVCILQQHNSLSSPTASQLTVPTVTGVFSDWCLLRQVSSLTGVFSDWCLLWQVSSLTGVFSDWCLLWLTGVLPDIARDFSVAIPLHLLWRYTAASSPMLYQLYWVRVRIKSRNQIQGPSLVQRFA